MIADYNSKPLQGKLFSDMHNQMMGVRVEEFPTYNNRYKAILEHYDLFGSKEKDLFDLFFTVSVL